MTSSDAALAPLVRVEDASLVSQGGPARLALSGLDQLDAVADAVASAGGIVTPTRTRLVVTAVPSRLVHAAGRVGGATLAEPLEHAIDRAVDAWRSPPPDLELPGDAVLPCRTRPAVMGILNVTPDSFSDGGEFFGAAPHPEAAVEQGRALAAAGADLVDVGGESTRPGASPVDEDEELARVLPVVEQLAAEGVAVSIDTTKATVARAAVKAGAVLVNDVSAGRLDEALLPTVAELDVPYVLMHMLGTPRTMQQDPRYDDVVAEVFDFLALGIRDLAAAGVPAERVVVDPGIGFGKTLEHNVTLLRRVRELTSLGRPVLVGASRKSFIGRLSGEESPGQRLEGSLAVAALAVAQGASVLRVHDVAATRRAVAVARAVAYGASPGQG